MNKKKLNDLSVVDPKVRNEEDVITLSLKELDLRALNALDGTALGLVIRTLDDSGKPNLETCHHSSHTSYNSYDRWVC